jgi:NADPH2:quinone reductase
MEAHMNFAREPTNPAVGIHEFGGPSVVGVIERAIPRPLSDEVLVRVHAATVNPTDTLFRTGAQTGRMAGLTPPFTPGMEFAGQVIALGDLRGDVPEFQVGDRVAGVVAPWQTRGGAQARFVAAPASGLAHIPTSIGYDEAATVPMNGLTALMAVQLLGLEPRSWVLVTGGVGALGGYSVSVASHLGYRVIADGYPDDASLLTSLGAELVVPRGQGTVDAVRSSVPGGVDGIIDGARLGPALTSVLRDGGVFAQVRREPPTSDQRVRYETIMVTDHLKNTGAIRRAMELAAKGIIRPRVARRLPIEQAADAHRLVEQGGLRGRVVLFFED